MKQKPVYFENLDALRALAFGSVFLFHVYGYLSYTPAQPLERAILDHFVREGHFGVNLFFVISGFLISYLLFTEKEELGTIRIGYFYLRRVLRIWPLYFAVLFLGFIVFPLATGHGSFTDLKDHGLWYVFFLNNFDRIATGFTGAGNDSLGVMWSIAVEEQFYLVWPLLLSLLRRRQYPYLLLGIIVASLVYRSLHAGDASRLYLHTFSVMSDLAVGGLLAYSARYQTAIFRFIRDCPRAFIVSVYLALFAAVYWYRDWSEASLAMRVGERLILSLGFAFVIGEQCFARHSFFKLGRLGFLNYLGIISYGLYCLHMYAMMLFQKLQASFHLPSSPLVFYTGLLCILALSILCSILSYRFFEKPLLRFKARFLTVPTGKDA